MEINRNKGTSQKNTTHPRMGVGFSRATNAMCLIYNYTYVILMALGKNAREPFFPFWQRSL